MNWVRIPNKEVYFKGCDIVTKIDKINITGLTKEKKDILKNVINSCGNKISFSDILHELRDGLRSI